MLCCNDSLKTDRWAKRYKEIEKTEAEFEDVFSEMKNINKQIKSGGNLKDEKKSNQRDKQKR